MCKKLKGLHNRIDPCMKIYIETVNKILKGVYETKACCCGHGKYPKTVVVGLKNRSDYCFELFSAKMIYRNKRFYKRDKQGYYFIPEVING